MDPFGRALIRAFVDRGGRRPTGEARRGAYGLLEGYVSVVVNTVLFAVKLGLGLVTGSLALVADAVHTLADSLTSIVVVVSSYASRKPADAEHPYGHGRVEAIATVTIAVLLGVAAVELGRGAVGRVAEPRPISASWVAIGIVLATAGVKEWLARFARGLGRETGSTVLEADAWHHRSDVFATVLVAVAMVAGRYGLASVDGWMGLAVSLVIAKVAFDVARGAVDSLIGKAPTPAEIEGITRAAMAVEGVRSVHDVVVHHYGETRFVSLHVETTDKESPARLHSIAERVEAAVGHGHGSVCVHVDPVDNARPDYAAIRAVVEEVVADDPSVESFHDLRLEGPVGRCTVLFDVVLRPGCTEPEAREVRGRLAEVVGARSGAGRVVVEVDPAYSYQ